MTFEPAALLGIDPVEETWVLSEPPLTTLLVQLGLEPTTAAAVVALSTQTATTGTPFEVRTGEWTLDLPAATARAAVNSAFLTALLTALGEQSLPAILLSMMVPFLFDVQRVEISASDRYVYAQMLEHAPDSGKITAWYRRLPDHVRAELSELEFRDLLQRLEAAGLAQTDNRDWLRVGRPSGRRVARLRLPPATAEAVSRTWAAGPSPPGTVRDVFISHARADKDAVARPLANALLARGYSVWFDEFELLVGDRLSTSIDRGLATSRCVVVVLSQDFFQRPWTARELSGLVARETVTGEQLVLPVWHNIEPDDVLRHSPPLTDLLAVSTADGIDAVVAALAPAIDRRRGQE